MLISDISHFLDKHGNIAKEMPEAGRETASFLVLIVDTATKEYEPPIKATEIRCLESKCKGTIELGINPDDEAIEWWCTDCDEAGRISGWQGTRWDNR